ncbi:MAG: CRISPR-associated endonuclease Cas3'' [Candidatus Levyibacteriota bacterium]
MSDSLSVLQEKIITHPYFQKTKTIIENNVCHENESVYDHSLATAKRADECVTGAFVSNPKAKVLFNKWMQEEPFGMQYKHIAVVIALLHDIGKILVYEENSQQIPLNAIQEDGKTRASGHEYWGSTIVPEILCDVGLSAELATYIANIVKLHGVLMMPHFVKTKTLEEYISDMKTQGQGFEKEILFNIYADTANCPIFKSWLETVIQIFNIETFYQKRNYVIA